MSYPAQRNRLFPGMTEKRCARCAEVKLIDSFPKATRRPDGHEARCRACRGMERKERSGREKSAARIAWDKAYYANHREVELARGKARNAALRAETLAAYGGECDCCGEFRQEFLSIDHENGRGPKDTRELNAGGRPLYLILKKAGWPKDGIRLLCLNCNFSRGRYGYCPHERERKGVETFRNT